MNGAGGASQGPGTVFCTPSGVVIPGLVALPPSMDAANHNSASGNGSLAASPPAGYEPLRISSGGAHYKPSSSSSALASSQAGQC